MCGMKREVIKECGVKERGSIRGWWCEGCGMIV